MERLFSLTTLETGLGSGFVAIALGVGFLLFTVERWARVDFGPLDYGTTLRWVVPGVTLIALGVQTALWSFFIGLLGMKRK
jgi:hypothetical protein